MLNSPGNPTPPPPPPAYPAGTHANQLAVHYTSGGAIFGGFLATVGCAIFAFFQFLSAVVGLAFDSPIRPQTESELRYGRIWEELWKTSILAVVVTVVALVITINASSHRDRRIIQWVWLPLVVNLVLCVATWTFGLASIPD